MSYDHELILIKPGRVEQDDIGNEIIVDPVRLPILCGKKSIGRNEYYNAATAGMRPEIVFVIHGYEYDGQTLVEFEEKQYNVVRTYQVDFEELELTCERVASNA